MISLPDYQITTELYIGNKTVVYRGQQLADQTPSIIKSLSAEYPTPTAIARLKHEYEILKNLDLPGVIRVLEWKIHNNCPFLILEDFGGISLQEYITNTPLELDSFLQIAIELTQILAQLHQHRVIHKDIKPHNIIIRPDTKQVQLCDFALASLLERENQSFSSPNLLEGTLAYISPEQTGRMNRVIDYRTDFYSLGVTFYEILTGQLPFTTTDPMELVHCHIAKVATAPHELKANIPVTISALVMKLLAKTAEERYQSAYGIKADLETCLEQLAKGMSEPFILGQQDLLAKFEIPQKLYGRESEVATLMDAFERVSQGKNELMLVAGYSGIGKTAVVNEVHKPIVRQRGYFIAGKFDQFKRNIPYASLIQAFRELMRQILTESETQIQTWREKLLAALGNNGQVIIDVIPEVELIVGQQPTVIELPPTEAQNRFNLVFKKFIQVFTQKEHPLVMFLDDLQWADSASLKLIQILTTNLEGQYLLTIGAYRDNEVSPTHPLMQMLDEIQQAGATVNTITLQNLAIIHINQLIANTLHCNGNQSQPLAELVLEKTAGNPFFLTQLLKYLYLEGFLTFNLTAGCWQWNIEELQRIGITDNVVALMVSKIQKLPEATQNVLKLAACIGDKFDLNTLTIVNEKPVSITVEQIWQALQAGLLLPLDNSYKIPVAYGQEVDAIQFDNLVVSYKFLHDRVQQAAYSLIAEEDKQATHLKIGQLLLQNTNPDELEENIFDIVNHLNAGVELICDPQTKLELTNLNLIAGQKAKASTAYRTAVKHLNLGIKLLSENSLEANYQITFSLYRDCAECEYLIGNFEQSKALFLQALNYSKSKFDKAEIYSIEMNLSMTKGDFETGIQAGLEGLELLGLKLPKKTEELKKLADSDSQYIESKLAKTNIPDLFHQPEQKDRTQNFVMQLLVYLWTLAYLNVNPDLSSVAALKMVLLSLEHGNTSLSAFGYIVYGMTLAIYQKYQTAYEFGNLALQLNTKFQKTDLIGKVNNLFCQAVNPYKQHLKTNLPLYKESYQRCMECGDLPYAAWALFFIMWNKFELEKNLQSVADEAEKYQSALQQINDLNIYYSFLTVQRTVWNLQGKTPQKYNLDDENFEEASFIQLWEANNFDHALNWHSYLKSQLLYLYGDYQEALKVCQATETKVAINGGFLPVTKYYFYYSLILAAVYPTASEAEQKIYWETLEKNREQLKIWTDNCPENFLNQYSLVSAEMARISNQTLAAIDFYEQAIESAHHNEFIQNEALANELAAKFWLSQGKEKYAKTHMREAHYGYQRWGAKRKVEDLEARYSSLLAKISARITTELETTNITTSLTSSGNTGALDLNTVVKASQVLASELVLDKLLTKLMKIVIENAGAQIGYLILPSSQGQLLIEAEGSVDSDKVTVLQSIPIENTDSVSPTIINYVTRANENVVLNDATVEDNFTNDPYIQQHQPKSILCFPLINQGQLVSIVYLENNLTTGAFTPDRVEVLRILSSQAAISIENARLYQTLEDKVEERTAQLAQANQEITALNERLKAENLRMSAELEVTKQLQQMVLPKQSELEAIEGLEIAGFMEPADEVGGDYYDVLPQDGKIKISIGDVTGHGLESGVVMLMAQTAVRTLQESNQTDPVQFLDILNRTIYRNVQRINPYKNLTLSLLEYAEGNLSVSGQHEEVIIVRAEGQVECLDTRDLGFPLGLDEEISDFIAQEQVQLNRGDVVVLYTDGITEAFDINQEQYGLEKLCEVVRVNCSLSAESIKQAVIDDVRQHIGSQKVFDDITLVVLKQK